MTVFLFIYLVLGLVTLGFVIFIYAVEYEKELFGNFYKYFFNGLFLIVPLWPIVLGIVIGFKFMDYSESGRKDNE